MSRIERLPGVGPQLAARIRTAFRTEDAFFEAAEAMDVQRIATIPGVSERRAVDLVLAARGDDVAARFMATPAAKRVHERIMARILRYAATETGRNRLRLLHPLPTQEAADASIKQVLAAKSAAANADAARVRTNLRKLNIPREPTPTLDTGTLVVAESDETYDALHQLGVHRWATLGTPRDLAAAMDYDVVVIAYDEGSIDASSIPHAIDVPADGGLEMLCPQAMLAAASDRAGAVQACLELAEIFDRPTIADRLGAIDAATANKGDPASIRTAVANLHHALNGELEAAVAQLQLSGPELLRAMANGVLPPAIQSVTDAVLRDARVRLNEATGIPFQPFIAGLPLSIDEDELERVIREVEATGAVQEFQAKQTAARQIAQFVHELDDEVRAWLDYDAEFALAQFALDHDLHAPSWGNELAFTDSVHLDLANRRDVQRIAYNVGGEANVAVLTGANSGGKSTLLEHLCQLTLMARMGLPVVGNATVPWLDEIHLVTARRGMDAGAFETFLRGFLPVTRGDVRRLVLADEVESVTELQAAGRIIAFVLDRLAATESIAVIVTHLAPQVLEHVQQASVRVDGIEASGLDEQHRLVVNRQPRMGHHARSTPELIIQRLAATTKGTERELFEELAGIFEGRQA